MIFIIWLTWQSKNQTPLRNMKSFSVLLLKLQEENQTIFFVKFVCLG